MLHRVKEVISCAVTTSDGEIGHIKDILIDDHSWDLRYFVIETGSWLHSQQVLLTPAALRLDTTRQEIRFTTQLTKKQVEESPPLTSDLALSRQYEGRLHSHYDWGPYWSLPYYDGMGMYVFPMTEGRGAYPYVDESSPSRDIREMMQQPIEINNDGEPHLRSFNEVKGYAIAASDGKIGHLVDGLIDARFWRLSHLVIDTHNWLPTSNEVVVDLGLVRNVDWSKNEISVNLSREKIKGSPPYDPARLIDDQYKTAISAYYHRVSHDRSSSINANL